MELIADFCNGLRASGDSNLTSLSYSRDIDFVENWKTTHNCQLKHSFSSKGYVFICCSINAPRLLTVLLPQKCSLVKGEHLSYFCILLWALFLISSTKLYLSPDWNSGIYEYTQKRSIETVCEPTGRTISKVRRLDEICFNKPKKHTNQSSALAERQELSKGSRNQIM